MGWLHWKHLLLSYNYDDWYTFRQDNLRKPEVNFIPFCFVLFCFGSLIVKLGDWKTPCAFEEYYHACHHCRQRNSMQTRVMENSIKLKKKLLSS